MISASETRLRALARQARAIAAERGGDAHAIYCGLVFGAPAEPEGRPDPAQVARDALAAVARGAGSLSEREALVFGRIAAGAKLRDIAPELGLQGRARGDAPAVSKIFRRALRRIASERRP